MSEPINFNPQYIDPRAYDWSKGLGTPEGYKSPIDIYIKQMVDEITERRENELTCKVSEYLGIEINKEELTKALVYDRHQYEKGYQDARRAYERPHGKWELKENEYIVAFQCSACRKFTLTATPFCPCCGAEMETDQEAET